MRAPARIVHAISPYGWESDDRSGSWRARHFTNPASQDRAGRKNGPGDIRGQPIALVLAIGPSAAREVRCEAERGHSYPCSSAFLLPRGLTSILSLFQSSESYRKSLTRFADQCQNRKLRAAVHHADAGACTGPLGSTPKAASNGAIPWRNIWIGPSSNTRQSINIRSLARNSA